MIVDLYLFKPIHKHNKYYEKSSIIFLKSFISISECNHVYWLDLPAGLNFGGGFFVLDNASLNLNFMGTVHMFLFFIVLGTDINDCYGNFIKIFQYYRLISFLVNLHTDLHHQSFGLLLQN